MNVVLCLCIFWIFYGYRLDGNFFVVVKIFVNNGFEKVYFIKGGVEGFKGWLVNLFEFLFFGYIIMYLL